MKLPETRSRTALADRRKEKGDEALTSMGLLDHLEELRRRIVYSLLALVVACGLSWAFVEEIAGFLEGPLPEGMKLIYLGPADPLMLFIKVALLAGVFVASPVILWQAWCFIAPGLYSRERRWAAPFVILGTAFFIAGGAFAYYIAFPFALDFLLSFAPQFEAEITIERYYSFLMTVILGLGAMFELPIVIFVLAHVGIVTPGFLMRHFRWAVILIFLVAAIITPTPDVVNLCVFALPTIGLYLLGVGAAWITLRGKKKRREAEAAEAADDD